VRLTLIAVPVVLLGAGGYYLWHGSSQPAITPTVEHAPVPATITTGDGRVLPSPATHPTAGSGAQTDGSTTAASAPVPSIAPATGSATPPAAARVDVHGQDYLRTHDRLAPPNEKKLAVPMPGLSKLQNKIGTQAKCQGPDAEQHYAALSGQERLDFAKNCKRVGIALPQ
jgi:hypothetical protein